MSQGIKDVRGFAFNALFNLIGREGSTVPESRPASGTAHHQSAYPSALLMR
jgi:hypothetical protein